MTDNYGGVGNFYLTNGLPGHLADISTPVNAEGYRIAMGQHLADGYYGISVSGRMGNGLAILDRAELVQIRDAITAELERTSN